MHNPTIGTGTGPADEVYDQGPTLRFEIIDARARQLGLSKGQLARRIGVDPTTMWRYRRGMHPTMPVLMRLRDVLGVSIDSLIFTDAGDDAGEDAAA